MDYFLPSAGRPSGVVSFPIDFFEHCLPMNDVEYGGNDLLQVYNVQQVKHRLNTTGMYVANTKVDIHMDTMSVEKVA